MHLKFLQLVWHRNYMHILLENNFDYFCCFFFFLRRRLQFSLYHNQNYISSEKDSLPKSSFLLPPWLPGPPVSLKYSWSILMMTLRSRGDPAMTLIAQQTSRVFFSFKRSNNAMALLKMEQKKRKDGCYCFFCEGSKFYFKRFLSENWRVALLNPIFLFHWVATPNFKQINFYSAMMSSLTLGYV